MVAPRNCLHYRHAAAQTERHCEPRAEFATPSIAKLDRSTLYVAETKSPSDAGAFR
jgi:hypothetical protein